MPFLATGLPPNANKALQDVAYRFFSKEKRKFIVADTPGHEQYTRNMVTGVFKPPTLPGILVDARQGVLTQTRPHIFGGFARKFATLFWREKNGVWSIDQGPFSTQTLPITGPFGPPKSALKISRQFPFQGWPATILPENPMQPIGIAGPTLIQHLETVEVDANAAAEKPFRMPVQWVNRPNLDFRGFSGLISSGKISTGDNVRIVPSGRNTTIKSIVTQDGTLSEAVAGQSVTLTFNDEV
ncbi:MAG: hypothetical protein CM15mP21_8140 [Hyphomicrobiales bacterium]|nr:MAG: hypothetical protein CM15mP21_8140 [Hyphomicrobiales bacterium]